VSMRARGLGIREVNDTLGALRHDEVLSGPAPSSKSAFVAVRTTSRENSCARSASKQDAANRETEVRRSELTHQHAISCTGVSGC
jgi:hypothetical protein